jgi:hypothetical protein
MGGGGHECTELEFDEVVDLLLGEEFHVSCVEKSIWVISIAFYDPESLVMD